MAKNSTKPKDGATPAVEDEQVNATPAVEDEQVNATPAVEDEQVNATTATEDEGNAASATEEDPFVGTHVVNTARGLNLREAPSYGAPVVEVLPCGTAVEDIDPEGAPAGWLHVMTEDGKAGFVAARYVDPVKE